jgi:hypothetical protein
MAADSPVTRRPGRHDLTPQTSNAQAADADSVTPSDDDAKWEQVQAWMLQHCPHRMQFLQRMPANPRLSTARAMMIRRYYQIQRVPYPPMRRAMINELEAQDQIFGAQLALRVARRNHNPMGEAKAEAELHAAVTRLFDGQLEIKRVQVRRHQDEIDRLTRALEDQEKHRDQLVDNWFRNMRNRADNAAGGPPASRGPVQNAAPDDASRPSQDQ